MTDSHHIYKTKKIEFTVLIALFYDLKLVACFFFFFDTYTNRISANILFQLRFLN